MKLDITIEADVGGTNEDFFLFGSSGVRVENKSQPPKAMDILINIMINMDLLLVKDIPPSQ
jgi:hypothetical protein